MKILLVEPDCQKKPKIKDHLNDETLWYPPLGLMKLSRFHKNRGDDVKFVRGCDSSLFKEEDLFSPAIIWDRVYIATLFTFNFAKIIKTINFYKAAVGGTINKIFIGGIMASLMPDEIYKETGIYPITGILNSPNQIRLTGNENIDELTPDYEILDNKLYAINHTFYAYTTRGCTNKCKWCGVPTIEPEYIPYIDIKPIIQDLRSKYDDKPKLKLMDNNILASPYLEKIVDDLLILGYGKNQYTNSNPKQARIIDFNQGIDASYMSEKNIKLLSQLNIKPVRVAFDRISEKNKYINAIEIGYKYGFREFSTYMLYNFKDTPYDLYKRLIINIKLNEKWYEKDNKIRGKVYSYPMRYAPIKNHHDNIDNKERDYINPKIDEEIDWLKNPIWTKRFIRNIEIMKGAAHGAISVTPTLAWRTIGHTFQEFLTNLYMPEELLRNRNKHEKKLYRKGIRQPGTGLVEKFRKYILILLRKNGQKFQFFHDAIKHNSVLKIREYINECDDKEMIEWLKLYLKL